MRIVFSTSGGFASIPGLAAPLTLDLDALPEAEQQELRQLVERSAFFALPSQRPRPRAADQRTYTITIEDDARTHTLMLSDPLPAGDLRVLVDRLRWHAAVARRSARGTHRGEPQNHKDHDNHDDH
jgi:hypothetical protein